MQFAVCETGRNNSGVNDDFSRRQGRQSRYYEYFYGGSAAQLWSEDPGDGARLYNFENYVKFKMTATAGRYTTQYRPLRQENIGIIFLYDIYYEDGFYHYKKSLPSTYNIRLRYHSNGSFADAAYVNTYAKTTFI